MFSFNEHQERNAQNYVPGYFGVDVDFEIVCQDISDSPVNLKYPGTRIAGIW